MKNPNGLGTVYKQKGNRRKKWIARKTVGWRECGDRVIQKRIIIGTFETKGEAMEALATYDIGKRIHEMEKISIEIIYKKWFELKREEISKQTIKIYTSMYNAHFSKIKEKNFREMKYIDWQEFINAIPSKNSAKTIQAMLKGIYSYAIKTEVVDTDYSRMIKIGRIEKKLQRKIFTPKEINILWENSENKYISATLILLFTGMRIGELLKLKTKDIHFEERYLIAGSKTEEGKERIIPIHSKIVLLLEKLISAEGEYILVDENKKRINYDAFRKEFTKILGSLGLKHTLHDTRHTFISAMDNFGVNKVALRKIVGHKNIETTEKIYTHKRKEQLLDEIEKLKY